MIDRLSDFKKILGREPKVEPLLPEEEKVNFDRELIKDFLEHCQVVEIALGFIGKNNNQIEKLAEEQWNQARASKQVNKNELNKLLEDNASLQKEIRTALAKMQSDADESATLYPKEPETVVKRIVHRTLLQEFGIFVQSTQKMQIQFKEKAQDSLKKQLRLIHKDKTEDELNALARDPDAQEKLTQSLMQNLTGQTAHSKVQAAVSGIHAKYKAILQLERSCDELHELFVELAALIKKNGEMLNQVESNFDQCIEYQEKAEQHLSKAEEIHKHNQKLTCWILLAIVIILSLVLMWLFGLF